MSRHRPSGWTAALGLGLFSVFGAAALPCLALQDQVSEGGELRVNATRGASATSSLSRRLDALLTALPHRRTLESACVIDLVSGDVVHDRHGDRSLVPASVMKVFVMAASLVQLGPEFAFDTVLALDGSDLVVIGGGDPGFGDERLCNARGESPTAGLQRWADLLLHREMLDVQGDLVIDESIFDDQWVHPSWEESDLDNWYAAPVGGLNINDNCVDITLIPSDNAGLTVSVQPPNNLAVIVNKCRAGDGKALLHHPHDSFEYRLSGRCNKRWSFGSVSFPDPGLLFADSLRTVLSRNGIHIGGNIVRRRVRQAPGLPNAAGSLPPRLTVLASHSTRLTDCLRRVGKNSQNFFAECVLKRMGYEWSRRRGSAPMIGSWTNGAGAVTEMLLSMGIDHAGFRMADGSGLSRDNQCTAKQLASVLAMMSRHRSAPVLLDSLSVAGVDGSLRKRLKDVPGRVVAKTGTMRGVRTLAGYVLGGGEPRYAFAILFNNYPGPSTPYRKIQDSFCRVLIDAGGRARQDR